MAASTPAIFLPTGAHLPPNRFPTSLPLGTTISTRHTAHIPALRAAAAPAAPPTSASGVVLVDPTEAQKVNRLKSVYLQKVVPILKEEFSYNNIHDVPKIEKVVVNCGMGDAEQNSKGLEAAMKDLALITGQRPIKTKAKKSIAAFKLREGTTVGIAVTLRGNMINDGSIYVKHPFCKFALTLLLVGNMQVVGDLPGPVFTLYKMAYGVDDTIWVMYSFLDRLINLGLPRTRDFQGVNPNSFDGQGNYAIGVRDQSVFPEIRYEALGKQRGMDVCITTTANTDNEAQRLLALLGMPFKEGGGPTVLIHRKKRKAAHFDSKKSGRR